MCHLIVTLSLLDRAERTASVPRFLNPHLSEAPAITTVSRLRALADLTGQVIIPVRHLDPNSILSADKATGEAFRRFNALSRHLDLYVLCPLDLYAWELLVLDDEPHQRYVPVELADDMRVINLFLPYIRRVAHTMRRQEDELKVIGKSTTDLVRTVNFINETAVTCRGFGQLVSGTGASRVKTPTLEGAITPELRPHLDPITFLVPKGTSLGGEHWAVLGPCWGPEVTEDDLTSLNLKPISGQGNLAKRLTNHWIRQWIKPFVSEFK